jgi:lysophospholipase L1-like esterase
MNAASFAEGLEQCFHPSMATLKSYLLQDMLHPKSLKPGGMPDSLLVTTCLHQAKPWKKKRRPAVFLTGDSTVKNNDDDEDGMWGWGAFANTIFNEKKITPVNVAIAGRSTRTYLREGRWEAIYNTLQPGYFVLIEFGHNDICPITDKKARGVIPGTKDTCHVYKMEADGSFVVVYSFGWYLKKFIDDVREKGATPILVSLTPRNEWPNGKVERRNDSYGKWYREVVEETGVDFLDIHNIIADYVDKKYKGKEDALPYFKKDHTHTSMMGAKNNAKCVAKGLKQMKHPLAKYLK